MSKRSVLLLAALLLLIALFSFALGTSYAQEQFGSNWQAQYYNNVNFSGTPLTRVDAAINFNYGAGSPDPSIPADNFAARWTGTQTFATAGTYTFTLVRDEGARVFLDGALIINQTGGGFGSFTVDLFVSAGPHTIVVEYFELTGNAQITFSWRASGTGVATVTFSGPTPTAGPTNTPTITALPPIPPGAISATVIRASVLNVRSAPFLGADVLGRILRGQTYAIVGRNSNATWFLLQLSGYQGWAFGYYLAFNGNEFNAPVVSAAGSGTIVDLNTQAVGITQGGMRLRAQPTTASAQIGRIPWGETIPITGRTADGQWYRTSWFGTVGWVYAPFIRIVEGNLNNVPVVP
ncbi:MAG: SH3 domain-containing protein [Chloroflexi bacterium]|nr:SH3 domain-containing protein [Chloroflexota bacterium]